MPPGSQFHNLLQGMPQEVTWLIAFVWMSCISHYNKDQSSKKEFFNGCRDLSIFALVKEARHMQVFYLSLKDGSF